MRHRLPVAPIRAVAAAILLAVATAWAFAPDSGPARQEPVYHCLAVNGTRTECGMAHGRAMAEQVRVLVGLAERYGGRTRQELWAAALGFEPFISARHRQEMEAIAAGAGVDYRDVLAVNCWCEMQMRQVACRQVVALKAATAQGRLIHGRNLDWIDYGGVLSRYVLALDCAPQDARRHVLVGWPGMIGCVTGANEKGLTIAMNQLGLRVRAGEPVFLLMRRVLEEADGLDAALQMLQSAPVTADAAIVVSDAAADRAACVEWLNGQCTVRGPEDGILAADNSPHGGPGDEPQSRMTLWRLARRQAGQLTPQSMQELLGDWRVLLPINIYSAVVVPQEKEMYLAAGLVPAARACAYAHVPLFQSN